MTDEEKKLKKYRKAVERRLNLPRNVRNRVMSDFLSGIQARRDSGMRDADIYAELGTPKQAAEYLNEQMKDYAYRKSPWRFVFLACAAYGAAELLGSLLAWVAYLILADPMLSMGESSSVGIIGGADGPTAIFVTTPGWAGYILPVLTLAVGIWGFLHFSRQKRK